MKDTELEHAYDVARLAFALEVLQKWGYHGTARALAAVVRVEKDQPPHGPRRKAPAEPSMRPPRGGGGVTPTSGQVPAWGQVPPRTTSPEEIPRPRPPRGGSGASDAKDTGQTGPPRFVQEPWVAKVTALGGYRYSIDVTSGGMRHGPYEGRLPFKRYGGARASRLAKRLVDRLNRQRPGLSWEIR